MNLEFAYNILDILQTMWDAAKQMEQNYVAGNMEAFHSLSMDLWDSLAAVQTVIRQETGDNKKIRLADACTCARESLKDIKLLSVSKPEKVEWKLAYELEPIIETAAMQFYYWGIVAEDSGKQEEFRKFLENTEAFGLLKDKEEQHAYLCDLIIQVTGYNHIDYTINCVQSILENLPKKIKTELVLFNHGSSDDTKAYFENLENVKVINVAENGVMPGIINKAIARGKYYLAVSNDIIIGKNAIENLYRCAKENEDYGYIVPTTPAVSNYQTISASYEDWGQFGEFTKKNNVYDVSKHEQRVRLCNPVHIMPSRVYEEMQLDMYEDKCCNWEAKFSFPDDKNSLWMRRHGYKNILAKDAYCHHFGSVTLRNNEQEQQEEERLYREGREVFYRHYGIDPWGTGFCYDRQLFEAWDIQARNNVSVLGLNCGIGSNSLKVKEVLREKGAQGITLYNGTQENCFLQDLKGISDYAFLFSELSGIVHRTGKRKFEYVVVEDPLQGIRQNELTQKIEGAGIEFEQLAYKKPDGRWTIMIH